jgi:hypothetical protein
MRRSCNQNLSDNHWSNKFVRTIQKSPAIHMKNYILQNLEQPEALERLYRSDKTKFRKAIGELQAEISSEPAIGFWAARFSGRHEGIVWGKSNNWLMVLLAAVLGGMALKLPQIFGWDYANYYPRNLAFAFLIPSGIFLAYRSDSPLQKKLWPAIAAIVLIIWVNFLPETHRSDTLILAMLHVPVCLWLLLSVADADKDNNSVQHRLNFIQYNAMWLVMACIISLATGLFTGICFGLFEAIGIHIQEWFFENIGLFILPAIPVAAALLVKENPGLLKPVAPMIARIFSPLALLVLLIYLPSMFLSDKNPITSREFLLIFNILLIGILALIYFSLPELSQLKNRKAGLLLLLSLSFLTVLIDVVALSAIGYRLFSQGITPNRLVLTGSNLLIFLNLILTIRSLLRFWNEGTEANSPGAETAKFLPIYGIWAGMVVFILPLLFGFH